MDLESLMLMLMKLIAQSEIVIFFNHEIRFDFDNDDKDRFYIIRDEFDLDSFFESDVIFINAQRVAEENSFLIFNIK